MNSDYSNNQLPAASRVYNIHFESVCVVNLSAVTRVYNIHLESDSVVNLDAAERKILGSAFHLVQ